MFTFPLQPLQPLQPAQSFPFPRRESARAWVVQFADGNQFASARRVDGAREEGVRSQLGATKSYDTASRKAGESSLPIQLAWLRCRLGEPTLPVLLVRTHTNAHRRTKNKCTHAQTNAKPSRHKRANCQPSRYCWQVRIGRILNAQRV